ncbi:MAG TPA: hypothetical protein VFW87_06615 [Pirellulales bacterium]|nr:hypothetical protein [Pirellulales bacterium]
MLSLALPTMWWFTCMTAGALALAYACCVPGSWAPAARVHRRLRMRRAAARDAGLPSLTLLIPALDEPTVVVYRIERALSLDYPKHRLQVVASLEGCDDRIEAAVRDFARRGVLVIDSIDDGRDKLTGEVVLVCDDDQPLNRKQLLEWLHCRGEVGRS